MTTNFRKVVKSMEKLGKVGKNYEKRDLTWLVDQRKDKSTIKAHGGYIQLAVFVFYSLQSNLTLMLIK